MDEPPDKITIYEDEHDLLDDAVDQLEDALDKIYHANELLSVKLQNKINFDEIRKDILLHVDAKLQVMKLVGSSYYLKRIYE